MDSTSPQSSGAPQTAKTAESSTDAELVAEVRRGELRAFEELYVRYYRRIAAYVLGMVGDHGRAEELTQDVFLSALRRMGDTERPIAFKPWIYEIAKNACIDQFRRANRAVEVSYDAEEGLDGADRSRLPAPAAVPELAIEQKQSLDDLLGAFQGLSGTHHEILVMREFEGRTYREIGERLGMTRPAVESTLFRARRRLGEEYEQLVTGERCVRVQDIIEGAVESVPGVRDRRRLSAHLSHCQPCRRHAAVAGLEVAAIAPRRIRSRVAGLVPLPAFLWRRWSGTGVVASPPSPAATLTHLGAQVSSSVDPAMGSWARAGAAAATLAVAGIAGGHAVHEHDKGAARAASPVAAPAATTVAAHVKAKRATGAATRARSSHKASKTTTTFAASFVPTRPVAASGASSSPATASTAGKPAGSAATPASPATPGAAKTAPAAGSVLTSKTPSTPAAMPPTTLTGAVADATAALTAPALTPTAGDATARTDVGPVVDEVTGAVQAVVAPDQTAAGTPSAP